MQMSQQLIPIAAMYDHLFEPNRKENRLEFVSDFPYGNDAKVISALQIHPQGWCALSRNISHDDRSEPFPETEDKSTRDTVGERRPAEGAEPEAGPSSSARTDSALPATRLPGLAIIQNDVWEASITIKQHRMLQEMYNRPRSSRVHSALRASSDEDIHRAEVSDQHFAVDTESDAERPGRHQLLRRRY
ncbi:unnamed protein product [Leptidea sinapis]|nr:unnamed protein product [Leptidea sinapis]